MRRTGPLGPTLRRLRGYGSLPAGVDRQLLADIEAGRVVPSTAALRALAGQLELDLVALGELESAHRETVGIVRANPWAMANARRAG